MIVKETVKIHVITLEEKWAYDMAKEIQREIDREVLDALVKAAEDYKKKRKKPDWIINSRLGPVINNKIIFKPGMI